MEQVRVLIDTDLGDDVDDAAALMVALQCEKIKITGITTVYKDTYKRLEMVRDLLAQYGKEDISLCPGYGDCLVEKRKTEKGEPIQYGLVRERKAAAYAQTRDFGRRVEDFIIHKVRENPDLTILAMGPLTNLAMAFLKEPELMRRVRIIGMGGAFFNTCPEWNIVCDPEAAKIVLDSSDHLILMGLDVTKYLRIEEKRLDAWKARGSRTMDYFLKGVRIFRETTGYPVTFHDVLLPAYLIDSQVVRLKQGNYTVELSGKLTRGTMVDLTSYYEIDPKTERNFYFAESVDLDRFFWVLDEHF